MLPTEALKAQSNCSRRNRPMHRRRAKMTNESPDIRTESEDCAENGGCTETRMDSIYKYLDGALDAQDFDEVRGHIEDCTECQSEHDVEAIIRDVVRRSCDEQAPETEKNEMSDRIAAQRTS